MPGYVCLYKWTQQGVGSLKGAPERISKAKEIAEKAGAKVVGV